MYMNVFFFSSCDENVDLDISIEEANTVLKLFLNNKFSEARRRLEPW